MKFGVKVYELFEEEKIDKEHIELMADENQYWQKASDFIIQVWFAEVWTLSTNQRVWLNEIVESMAEMRIEKRGVFYK